MIPLFWPSSNVCVKQFFAHETSLKAQMVETKVQETCTNLLLHRLGMVQQEVKRLADHMEKDLDLGASTLDHVQESIQSFGDKFGNLSDTLKDIVSSHRARYATDDEMRKKILFEISGAKEFLQHIRSNTQSVSKSFQNLVWETQELRCGGKDAASGTVSNNGGSLIAALNVTMENQGTLILEHLNKMGLEIKDAVEKGTDPDKSLKRKREEQDQLDYQQAKEELEKEKKRAMLFPVIHPYTGERMFLNEEQHKQFFVDLQKMGPEQFGKGGTVGQGTATGSEPSIGGKGGYGGAGQGYPSTPEFPMGVRPSGFPPGFPPMAPPNLPVIGTPATPGHPAAK